MRVRLRVRVRVCVCVSVSCVIRMQQFNIQRIRMGLINIRIIECFIECVLNTDNL